MFGVHQILVSAAAAAFLLAGCGQRGPLYLPTGEAAANRATLPQTLSGRGGTAPPAEPGASAPAPVTPPTGVANPVRNR